MYSEPKLWYSVVDRAEVLERRRKQCLLQSSVIQSIITSTITSQTVENATGRESYPFDSMDSRLQVSITNWSHAEGCCERACYSFPCLVGGRGNCSGTASFSR
jgi:hypothetical protein